MIILENISAFKYKFKMPRRIQNCKTLLIDDDCYLMLVLTYKFLGSWKDITNKEEQQETGRILLLKEKISIFYFWVVCESKGFIHSGSLDSCLSILPNQFSGGKFKFMKILEKIHAMPEHFCSEVPPFFWWSQVTLILFLLYMETT